MGVQERKQRDKERLRRKIVRAARELFASEGYDNVSMRRVAEKIEYSPTTIYLHFKDKDELLYSICEETFGGLLEKLQAIASQARSPLDALKRGLRAYIEFGIENPHHYRVCFMMAHPADPRYIKPDAAGMKTFNFLRQAVKTCLAARVLRGDAETISQALFAAIHGITSLLITHPDFPWVKRDRLIDSTIDAMVDGLRA